MSTDITLGLSLLQPRQGGVASGNALVPGQRVDLEQRAARESAGERG